MWFSGFVWCAAAVGFFQLWPSFSSVLVQDMCANFGCCFSSASAF